jgi:hypothetical protein
MHHSATPLLRRLMLLAVLPVGAWAAPGMPPGLLDHTICCGPKPSMNAEDFVEAGYDPMLRRQHLLSPVATPPAAAEPVKLPGTDGFVQEILPSAPPTIPSLATSSTPLPPTPPVAPRGPLVAPTEKIEGHLRVGFDVLAGYNFQMAKEDAVVAQAGEPAVAAKALGQIPEIVRKLDGQKVLLTGFMLPMKMEGPLATEFLLVANSMLCCYGIVPDMNQWVVVKMAKGGVKPQQDTPVQFFGKLRVQPRFDAGALSAIYQLDAERPRVAK